MRKEIFDNSISLQATNWVELRKLTVPDKHINGYDFLHEKRCDGNIVAFLPFKKKVINSMDTEIEFLLRVEAVPCWELDTPIKCSFTGGCDATITPRQTFIKELEEEAGYCIDLDEENRIIELGTSYSTKSSDSIYHLYAVNVTDFPEDKIKALFIESELEKASTNVWIKPEELADIKDPFVNQIVFRILVKELI